MVKETEDAAIGESAPSSSSASERQLVEHVASLAGHCAPITRLAFNASASLLASGCKAGSVRIWDISVGLVATTRYPLYRQQKCADMSMALWICSWLAKTTPTYFA